MDVTLSAVFIDTSQHTHTQIVELKDDISSGAIRNRKECDDGAPACAKDICTTVAAALIPNDDGEGFGL